MMMMINGLIVNIWLIYGLKLIICSTGIIMGQSMALMANIWLIVIDD